MSGGIRIVTNFPRFPAEWSVSTGERGVAKVCTKYEEFAAELSSCDLLLINGSPELVLRLCGDFLKNPGRKKPMVAVDLIFRRPESFSKRVSTFGKKILLKQVGHFINYFRESEGYAKYFGITPERSSFVHFKPNLRYHYEPGKSATEDYVLCFGRSQRDYDLFFEAMEKLPYPGAIPTPKFEDLRVHCSRFTRKLNELPPNVRVLDDDGSQEAMIRVLEGAKIIALPILGSSMIAGIGVYLNAMLLRKCLIISSIPGAADVLTDEAILIPPDDVEALRSAIRRAWEDDGLRNRVAAAGHAHALSLGGEPELRQRVLENTISWYRSAAK